MKEKKQTIKRVEDMEIENKKGKGKRKRKFPIQKQQKQKPPMTREVRKS